RTADSLTDRQRPRLFDYLTILSSTYRYNRFEGCPVTSRRSNAPLAPRRGDTAPARCKLSWHVVPGLTASDTCEIAPTVSSQESRDLPLRYVKECIADNTSRDTRCPNS
ncbi:hypothetical protein CH063_14248, partial [Colletotrichum higginsianum]